VKVGVSQQVSTQLELQTEDQKPRIILRALSEAYPHGVKAKNLMKLAGFGSRPPGAFISFCITRSLIDQAIRPTGWMIARTGGQDFHDCRLERVRP